MTGERVTLERADGIATVTLRRPARRNALDDRLLTEELPKIWTELANDSSVTVVVVAGEGEAFCAGADLKGSSGFLPKKSAADSEDFTVRLLEPAVGIYSLPQITVAAVQGAAVGAGFGMALACDIRVGGPRASFSSPFVTMGIVPDFGLTWTLPRIVGEDHALDILLTGRTVGAEEAFHLGLVTRMEPDPFAASIAYAQEMAAGPPRAIRVTKQLLRSAMKQEFAEAVLVGEGRAQAVALQGQEFQERFAAWRNRIISG